MEKKKRKACFLLTIIGVIVIIVVQTIILIDDEIKEKEENYIKTNILNAFNKCIKDTKCQNDTTLEDLIEKSYLDGYFLEEIKDYSLSSYVEYSSNKIYLIHKK